MMPLRAHYNGKTWICLVYLKTAVKITNLTHRDVMMKKELYQIYLSEFTARFCVWNVLSQLLMHLIHHHVGNTSTQLYLIGVSISLLYISTIFGGAIRDYTQNEKIVVMQ